MSLQPGEIVDNKYRIVRIIGEGGMGAVYEGENMRISRRVAIKVLHAAYAADPDVTGRFEREAQAAGRIGSDHILEILDLGKLANGDHYMVMEFLEGETLGSRIRAKERLSEAEAAMLVRQVLAGLAAAHQAQIVHRDLKPDNIFVLKEKAGRGDFVKIIDFGISKFHALNQEGNMTRVGTLLGSPYYMAPEQASGTGTGEPQSDIYSVGVILYQCITGTVPYDAQTLNQLMFKIVLSDFIPPHELIPELDPAFGSIVAKAMAKDPAHRFQNAQEFTAALDAWSRGGTGVTIPPADDSGQRMQQVLGFGNPQQTGNVATMSSAEAGGASASQSGSRTAAAFAASQVTSAQVPTKRKGAGAAVTAVALLLPLVVVGAVGGVWYLRRAVPAAEGPQAEPVAAAQPAALAPPVATPAQEPAGAQKAPGPSQVVPADSVVIERAVSSPDTAAQEAVAAADVKAVAGKSPAAVGASVPGGPTAGAVVSPGKLPAGATPSGAAVPPPKKKTKRDFGY